MTEVDERFNVMPVVEVVVLYATERYMYDTLLI